MVLLFSLQPFTEPVIPRLLLPFQAPVIPPRVLLPLSSLHPCQAMTSRLLIRQLNPQHLQFRRMVQLTASVPLSMQAVSLLFIEYLMDLRGPGDVHSLIIKTSWRSHLPLFFLLW